MCFVRYDFEYTSNEEFLFCKPLNTRTTAEEIFNLIDTYINRNDIDWKKCVGLSSDGARAMAGVRTGLFPKIKVMAPECVWVHCSIHREALAIKNAIAFANCYARVYTNYKFYKTSSPEFQVIHCIM